MIRRRLSSTRRDVGFSNGDASHAAAAVTSPTSSPSPSGKPRVPRGGRNWYAAVSSDNQKQCLLLAKTRLGPGNTRSLNWNSELPLSHFERVKVFGEMSFWGSLLCCSANNVSDVDVGPLVTEIDLSVTDARFDLCVLAPLFTTSLVKMVLSHNDALKGDIGLAAAASYLVELNLDGCIGVTGNLVSLSTCFNLKFLHLEHTKVAGDVGNLKTCAELQWLSLEDTGVSGDVAQLSDLTKLRCLSLNGCPSVTGELASLGTCSSLKVLWLAGTQVTGTAKALAKDLPRCRVTI